MSSFKTPKGTELPLLTLKAKKEGEKGAQYLRVAHRLVWFREQHPQGRIETEALEITPETAIYRARISIPNDRGEYVLLATATKREDFKRFFDHIEKAETGSIGRALALCGFGTQFCAEELDESDRIADAGVGRAKKPATVPAVKPKNVTRVGGFGTSFGSGKGTT